MNKNYGKLKSVMFSIALAVGMLLPASSFAQSVEAETGGGLLGFGKIFGSDGFLFDENLNEEPIEEEGFGSNSGLFGKGGAADATITGSGIQNGDFEDVENVPLGSGIAIMMVAGLGYVALKKKEDKQ